MNFLCIYSEILQKTHTFINSKHILQHIYWIEGTESIAIKITFSVSRAVEIFKTRVFIQGEQDKMLFEELNINKELVQGLKEMGLTEPTDIQVKAIPLIKQGKDVISISKTGSGKTTAFGVPILENIVHGHGVQYLVIAPVRELAVQIAKEFKKFGKHIRFSVAAVYGGASINPQIEAIERADIVVGTPGRLLDHLENHKLDLSGIKCVVLDEADKMVEMGFIQDIRRILNKTPKNRQMLLFGATLSNEIEILKREYMHTPVTAQTQSHVGEEYLEQYYYDVKHQEKFSLLVHLLKKEQKDLAIIFCSARSTVEMVTTNLRDNGITRQRYWGTPMPVWRCSQCKEFVVVGSIEELKKLAGHLPEDLHKPWIDEVKIKCGCGGTKERVPDILDVWIDAGSASWNCLDYPRREDLFEKLYPADFILEGIDQIRGWFNLLFVASMVAMNNVSFKSVYMHGFINDAQGRKMSKSLGNYILPQEVIKEYGADTLRYYMIGGTAPGVDINYNFDDMKLKHKNLTVLWNLHKYLIEMAKNLKVNPSNLDLEKFELDIEERYIFSKLNSATRKITELFEEYKLNETPWQVEELFLELSRTYIQLTREKSSMGSDDDKKIVLYTVYNVFMESLKLFAPVAPFITERMYQNLKHEFRLKEESIHHHSWPKYNEGQIDKELEDAMKVVAEIVQSALAVREKMQLGVRWPIKELVVATKDNNVMKAVEKLKDVIKTQVNVKAIGLVEAMPNVRVKIKADYSKIGPAFGDKSAKVIAQLAIDSPETVLKHINEKGKYSFKADGETLDIVKEHLILTREVSAPYEEGTFRFGNIYLNKEMNDELEAEGFAREIMRRVQALRKKAGLQKSDNISLFLKTDEELKEMLKEWAVVIKEKVGASQFRISEMEPSKTHEFVSKEKVKGKEFEIGLEKE